MKFVTDKGTTHGYMTESLIRYKMSVTDNVLSDELKDWMAANPECVACTLHICYSGQNMLGIKKRHVQKSHWQSFQFLA